MSSPTPDRKIDIFDTRKTPEIYPMTSMHETMEYFHEKLNQLSTRAYENSATIQRLGEQLQQMSTRAQKPAASSEKTPPAPVPEPAAPAKAEKPDVMSMLMRRFSQQPAAPAAPVVPEPVAGVDEFAPPEPVEETLADMEPERPEVESIHFRRFSDQELESVQVHLRRPSEPRLESVPEPDTQAELDADSEQDVSPCLWQRLTDKFDSRSELESESVQQPDEEPQTPVRAPASAHGLKRLSLCMLPPDEMQDVLAVISPDIVAPAPSPALDASTEPASRFLR